VRDLEKEMERGSERGLERAKEMVKGWEREKVMDLEMGKDSQ
jgi:hypothetical protein